MRFSIIAAVLAALLVLSSSIAFVAPSRPSPNLIVNGGFETGSFYPGWIGASACGDTSVSADDPHTGQYAASLGSVGVLCRLTQVGAYLRHNHSYELSFWLLSDGDVPNALLVNATLGHSHTHPAERVLLFTATDLPALTYKHYQVAFMPDTTGRHNLTLNFYSQDNPGYLHLDDVSLRLTQPVA